MIQDFFNKIQKKGLSINYETKKLIEDGMKFLINNENYKSSIQFKIRKDSGWIRFQRTKFNVYGIPEFSESITYYLYLGYLELRVLNIKEKRVDLGVYNEKF